MLQREGKISLVMESLKKVVNFRENNLLNVEAGRLEDFERGILF